MNSKFSVLLDWWHHHRHHHVVPPARISLTLSRHFSLSFIASGRSSRPHPVSSHSYWMYVRTGRPAFARPYVGVHRSTSLMSSSLLLKQWPACLVRLTWIVFVMGGRWPYSWCMPFSIALVRNEIQTSSSKIWSQIAETISSDDNRNTMSASLVHLFLKRKRPIVLVLCPTKLNSVNCKYTSSGVAGSMRFTKRWLYPLQGEVRAPPRKCPTHYTKMHLTVKFYVWDVEQTFIVITARSTLNWSGCTC